MVEVIIFELDLTTKSLSTILFVKPFFFWRKPLFFSQAKASRFFVGESPLVEPYWMAHYGSGFDPHLGHSNLYPTALESVMPAMRSW